MHACPLDEVRYCLQTHPHADHLDLSHLLSRNPAFGVVGAPVLHFHASKETTMRAAQTFIRDLAEYSLLGPNAERELNVRILQINPLEYVTAGPYSVMAFPANHAIGMGPSATIRTVRHHLYFVRREYQALIGRASPSMMWGNPPPRPHPRKRRFAQGRRDSTAVQIPSRDFLGRSNYKAIVLMCPAAVVGQELGGNDS